MPAAPTADLIEWGPFHEAEAQFDAVLQRELSLDGLIQGAPGVPALQDDRPINEYCLWRRIQDPAYWKERWTRLRAHWSGAGKA